jgi:hypothetical protein
MQSAAAARPEWSAAAQVGAAAVTQPGAARKRIAAAEVEKQRRSSRKNQKPRFEEIFLFSAQLGREK